MYSLIARDQNIQRKSMAYTKIHSKGMRFFSKPKKTKKIWSMVAQMPATNVAGYTEKPGACCWLGAVTQISWLECRKC